ncbi:hypothetical protein MNEG_8121 [Monoraphidium neglectum]|uniref:Secreted protein n=1 Tax=Monoraphidium neglectum TaxID=145388 RepID=A0A0D2JKQ4_9CHLO|nr:hypothetical protein MNEG_8121 [Monoraphidium neglectum]KIY99842.1 hypothetical protein MNEG_8121 [Monoraphidium neglectum]|eukprot:XP_013898862.1 hypothetical protein MNEG_8121 [Monoraphidium neglectum]
MSHRGSAQILLLSIVLAVLIATATSARISGPSDGNTITNTEASSQLGTVGNNNVGGRISLNNQQAQGTSVRGRGNTVEQSLSDTQRGSIGDNTRNARVGIDTRQSQNTDVVGTGNVARQSASTTTTARVDG